MLVHQSSANSTFSLLLLVVVVLLLSEVLGDHGPSYSYCHLNINASGSTSPWKPPVFKDNFKVLVEQKFIYANKRRVFTVTNTEMYFSKQDEQARLIVTGANASLDIWALGNSDSLVEIEQKGARACSVIPLDQSTYGKFLSAAPSANKTAKLGYPPEVLQWSKGLEYYNFSKSDYLIDRGINVLAVQTCSYDLQRDATSVATFYFSDPYKTKMPGDPTASVLVRATVKGIDRRNKPFNFGLSYDYVNFAFGMNASKHGFNEFQMIADAYCIFPDGSTRKKIPELPRDLTYRLQKIIPAANGQTTTERFRVQALFTLGLYIIESVSVGSGQDKSRQIAVTSTLHDYSIGLQYVNDRISGNCKVTPIGVQNPDAIKVGSYVLMADPNTLMERNITYQYIGVIDARGIQCDAFVGKDQQNNVITWYFATDSWKRQMNVFVGRTLPVRMERRSSNILDSIYDFFEYSDRPKYILPDISNCFTASSTDNIQFIIKDSYTFIVVPDVPAFRKAVSWAIMQSGQFLSPTRIARIDFYPWTGLETLVQVTLLDSPKIQGDAKAPLNQPSNEDIIDGIRKDLDSDKFRITVYRGNSQYDVLGKRHSLSNFDPKAAPPTSSPPVTQSTEATPKPGTGPSVGPRSTTGAQKPTGGQQRTTGRLNPTHNTNTNTNNNNGNNNNGNNNKGSPAASSGYSPGSMAGLAIGMLLLAVVLTLGAVYLFYRFKFQAPSNDTIAMSTLQDSDS